MAQTRCDLLFWLLEKLAQSQSQSSHGIIIIFDSHLKTVPTLPLYIYKPKCFYIVSVKLNLKDQIWISLLSSFIITPGTNNYSDV